MNSSTPGTLISVSVIVPCRNEVGHIEDFLRFLLSQKREGIELEVLIADGMSTDRTREVLEKFCAAHKEVSLVDNPNKIVSTGLNAAILQSRGEVILRMDVHTQYSDDFIWQSIQVLQETGAGVVGGPWVAVGKTYLQRAIAVAFQSPFSSGGAGSHDPDYEGEVDSVYLGCWEKSTLVEIGLFDEELVRNQDDELNLRLARAGWKIWQSPLIRSWYYPRASLKALFRQYAQYGYWKVRVIQKHRLPASYRHLVPGGFVATLVVLAALSLWFPLMGKAFALLFVFYLFLNLLATLITCSAGSRWRFLPVLPLTFAMFHFGYGYGFCRGCIDFLLLKKGARTQFTQLTRG